MLNNVDTKDLTASKRLDVIDILRGFALLGIILVHSCQIYPDREPYSQFDKGINLAISHLFAGRATSIFCLLFGLSFAMQMNYPRAAGQRFTKLFIWRMIILLGIGYFHSLIYANDILQVYALLAPILILSANLKNRELFLLSLTFYLLSFFVKAYSLELPGEIQFIVSQAKKSIVLKIVAVHKWDFLLRSAQLFTIPSLFILGFYVGRKRIFLDTIENRLLFKRILIYSAIAVLTSTLIYYVIKFTTTSNAVRHAFYGTRQIAQTFFYIALIVILYRLDFFHRTFQWLVPIGQMGLSIYIMQSIILKLYYRLGADFIPELGLTASIGITILFFIVQIIFATWWMSRYRFGPAEWIWRSLTYFKWQPMLKHSYPSSNSEATNSRLPA